MNPRNSMSAALFVSLMAGAAPASAADYDFFYGADHVAKLTTTESVNSTSFSFRFLAAPDAGAFINDLLLDMGKGEFLNTTVGSTTPTYSFKAGGYEGTGMQTKISFPMANGSGRFTAEEMATWKIQGAFDGPARLHVNAFINGESVKLTTPVPEPEAYAMALVALGVLGAFRRFRRDKT